MKFRVCGFILIGLCCALIFSVGRAQSTSSATLSAVDTQLFPRVQAFLDVRTEAGAFVHALQPEDVRVIENDASLPAAELSELRPGVQQVICLNPGPSLGLRDGQGTTRLELLQAHLAAWARTRLGTTIDDWSLLVSSGTELTHTSSIETWLEALAEPTGNPREMTPNLDGLFRALDLASDALPRAGMGRAILFVTSPIAVDQALSVENLIEQARQQEVPVFVWFSAPAGTFTPSEGEMLNRLAVETGGQFFHDDGDNPLPDPEQYFAPLRSIYRLEYDSAVRAGGEQQVTAEIVTAGGTLTTQAVSFSFEIQPPEPIFLWPELEIERTAPPGEPNPTPADYLPLEHTLELVVEFPDGRVRPLRRTTLYVDGAAVAENTQPPFESFQWKLAGYTDSGEHSLRVEAEDSLGMVGSSMDLAVAINIAPPAANPFNPVSQNFPVFIGLAVLVSGALLALVLILGGRLTPQTQRFARQQAHKARPAPRPAPPRRDPAARPAAGWTNRLQWPQRHVDPKASAFLVRSTERDTDAPSAPVAIAGDEMILGSDPRQATLVLNDPSVQGLHARLVRDPQGSYRISDQGSTAGTWVNYLPVNGQGTVLEHGDVIHLGRVMFRFTLRQPANLRKPVVTPLEEWEGEISR